MAISTVKLRTARSFTQGIRVQPPPSTFQPSFKLRTRQAAKEAHLAAVLSPSRLQSTRLADPGANLGVLPPTSRAHAPPPERSGCRIQGNPR